MATRKKQTPNVSSGGWPKIQQGTHLTVKTFEDGHTELIWDDEALLQEVREALASVTPASKKSKKFNYSEPKEITNDDGSKSLEVRVTKKPAVKAKSNKKVPEAMKRKADDSALKAYDHERLVSKHDKIQAAATKKAPAKKTTKKTKTK